MAPKVGVEYDEAVVDYLIEKHYRSINRPLRCCQPRDLLVADSQFLPLRPQAGQDDDREHRLRGAELFRGDVMGKAPVGRREALVDVSKN